MHILFTLNEKYVPHLGALIISILKSARSDRRLVFHVISSDISQKSKMSLQGLSKVREFKINFYNSRKYNVDWSVFNVHMKHTSIETFYRLFAHEFLKNINKVIHLDIDTLVFQDIGPLWNINMEKYFAAGVACPSVDGKHLVPAGFRLGSDTFMHAGVNVLNLRKMREEHATDKIYDIVNKYTKILRFQDQDIMNILFMGKIVNIPLKYNAVTSIFEDDNIIKKLNSSRRLELNEAIKRPVIVHFSREIKAWHKNSKNPYAKYYKEFLAETPWSKSEIKPFPLEKSYRKIYYNIKRFLISKIILGRRTLFIRKAMDPLLNWHMKHLIRYALRKNTKNKFDGKTRGKTILSYINESDPIFFYLENILESKITKNPKEADLILLWGTRFFIIRYIYLLKGLLAGLPVCIAEDGFVRSVDIAERGAPGLSCIIDHTGIYYDADLGSLIDRDLESEWKISEDQKILSKFAIDKIKHYSISKYNMVPPQQVCFKKYGNYNSIVLILDQRKGDQSVSGARASKKSFLNMLNDAISDNPGSLILIKTHPDEICSHFKGYFSSYQPKKKNVFILKENLNPISLLHAVDIVYVVSSQMGMEALMCGKKVICYGAPFYSGWGLTEDRAQPRKRKKKRTLEELFYVSYIRHTKYYRPDIEQKTDIIGLLDYINIKIKNKYEEQK
jgi:capsular polysaccharide export protein